MVLILLVFLAAIPVLGIAWILLYGSLTTVDGLFMSLILLTISGILGMTALFELRSRLFGSGTTQGKAMAGAANSPSGDGSLRRGKVQEVTFFESNVGEPNKSVITLSDSHQPSQTLVLEGDLRNALPVGQKVQITWRKQRGHNVLVSVSYS